MWPWESQVLISNNDSVCRSTFVDTSSRISACLLTCLPTKSVPSMAKMRSIKLDFLQPHELGPLNIIVIFLLQRETPGLISNSDLRRSCPSYTLTRKSLPRTSLRTTYDYEPLPPIHRPSATGTLPFFYRGTWDSASSKTRSWGEVRFYFYTQNNNKMKA